MVTSNGRVYTFGCVSKTTSDASFNTPRLLVALQGTASPSISLFLSLSYYFFLLVKNLGKDVRQVACGSEITLFLTEAGEVYAMGGEKKSPVLVEELQGKGVRQVAVGEVLL